MKKRFKVPKQYKEFYTRPVSSRLMSALFSILRPYLKDKLFLDLYAGTGLVGIKALEEGAEFITFVDNSEEAYFAIEHNLTNNKLPLTKTYRAQIKVEDFLSDRYITSKNLKEVVEIPTKYDIIFADPPYKNTNQDKYYELIHLAKDWLNPGGIIAIKHPTDIKLENLEDDLTLADFRKYGSNALTFFVLPFENR
jgi:16S rRNA (guanine966-N2)-methyltransferase